MGDRGLCTQSVEMAIFSRDCHGGGRERLGVGALGSWKSASWICTRHEDVERVVMKM